MCAALLSPNCRDAFLRLSQQPSLRDWRFYSAILLAETQECVSTTFRRTHVNTSADKADIKSRWKPLDLFEALPVILPPNTCQLFPWDRIVRCLQLPAAPRGTRIVRQFLPAAPRGARIVRFSFPRLRVGQESCDFPSRGSAWGKNRATIPSRGFAWDKNRAAKPSRRLGETRIAPRNLPAAWERQETCVNSREFDEFHFMCAALLSPKPAAKSSRLAILFGNLACRDARMRLYNFSSNSR